MALILSRLRITCIFLYFFSLFTISCRSHDRISVFADCLKEEKRLRDHENDPEALRDSLALLYEKYGIDRDAEIQHVGENPDAWIQLLKDLKSDR